MMNLQIASNTYQKFLLFLVLKRYMLQNEFNNSLKLNQISKKWSIKTVVLLNVKTSGSNNPELQFYRFPGYFHELERKQYHCYQNKTRDGDFTSVYNIEIV